jgi:hypothetical protein
MLTGFAIRGPSPCHRPGSARMSPRKRREGRGALRGAHADRAGWPDHRWASGRDTSGTLLESFLEEIGDRFKAACRADPVFQVVIDRAQVGDLLHVPPAAFDFEQLRVAQGDVLGGDLGVGGLPGRRRRPRCAARPGRGAAPHRGGPFRNTPGWCRRTAGQPRGSTGWPGCHTPSSRSRLPSRAARPLPGSRRRR